MGSFKNPPMPRTHPLSGDSEFPEWGVGTSIYESAPEDSSHRQARLRSPRPVQKEGSQPFSGKASGRGPVQSPMETPPYLVGLGLHGHHSIEGNHEDHHGHPRQDGGAQVLREETRTKPHHRTSPG